MEDTTAPEIQSLALSSSQINLSEENSIKATIRLTDQGSGIGNNQLLNAAVRWRSPSGKQLVDASFYKASSGKNNDSIFIEDIDFNQYTEEGEWKIDYAETTDNAGNHKWLYPKGLKTLSLNRPITVFRSGNSTPTTNSLESSTDKELSTAEGTYTQTEYQYIGGQQASRALYPGKSISEHSNLGAFAVLLKNGGATAWGSALSPSSSA